METRTAGAEGGPGKRAGRDPGTALRPDPYFTGQIYFNGHEYAKQQCRKDGIAFTSLDNAFGAVSDPAAVQRICDRLTDQKIYRFAGKWLARLPQPFTRADEDADYRWQLPDGQTGILHDHGPGPAGERADLLRAADPGRDISGTWDVGVRASDDHGVPLIGSMRSTLGTGSPGHIRREHGNRFA